jgi:hypothetical protein
MCFVLLFMGYYLNCTLSCVLSKVLHEQVTSKCCPPPPLPSPCLQEEKLDSDPTMMAKAIEVKKELQGLGREFPIPIFLFCKPTKKKLWVLHFIM